MNDYLNAINEMRVNKNSPHKPLLLLLCITKIKKGHKNHFLYDDIEDKLQFLIGKYNTNKTAKINPQYPFVFLGEPPILWECSITKHQVKYPDAPSRTEVLGQTGKLNNEFYKRLTMNNNYELVISHLLTRFFEKEQHKQVLIDLI